MSNVIRISGHPKSPEIRSAEAERKSSRAPKGAIIRRRITALAVATTVGLGVAHEAGIIQPVKDFFHNTFSGNPSKDPMPGDATFDTNLNSLVLQDGAKVRFTDVVPDAQDPNNIATVINEQSPYGVQVSLPSGIIEVGQTRNGVWYGVKASELSQSLQEQGMNSEASAVLTDNSGTVWINEARAILPEDPTLQ